MGKRGGVRVSSGSPSRGAKKKKGSYEHTRKYKDSWEKDHPWLIKDPGGDSPCCTVCKNKPIKPKKDALIKHEESEAHKAAIRAKELSGPISFTPSKKSKPEKVKIAELNLAATVCCHMSIMSIDHLGEVIQQHGKNSSWEDLKLHRTKCSRLIDHVIAPSLKEELIENIAGVPYSLLMDESTDVSVDKNLVIGIIYFNKKSNKIEVAYLGTYPVIEATGAALFEVVSNAMEETGLTFEKMVGFGTDGASCNVGEHDSVFSRIKDKAPHVILFKCVCHSLALCVKHAFKVLPDVISFVMSEIAKWFSNSTKRREAFKALCKTEKQLDLFDSLDTEEPKEKSNMARDHGPLMPFVKNSQTRWLARGKLLKRVILNWAVLTEYFENVRRNGEDGDIRYKAAMIHEKLRDSSVFLYFVFLHPIMIEFDCTNMFFQATKANPEEMVMELEILYR